MFPKPLSQATSVSHTFVIMYCGDFTVSECAHMMEVEWTVALPPLLLPYLHYLHSRRALDFICKFDLI